MNKEKTVLVLSYYYPPYAGVAGQRTHKFCKFLPEHGWRPLVFTVDERYYGSRVIPTSSSAERKKASPQVKRVDYLKIPGRVVLMKLMHPLLALWFALRHRRQLGAFYMSGSPYHPFLLTPLLTGLLRIPTVLDFRDSWSINHGYDGARPSSWRARLRETALGWLERLSIRFASRVIFATTRLQAEYTELFPQWRRKFSTIHNGFDPEEIAATTPVRHYPGLTLVLTGKFHIYTPEAVGALMQTLRATPELAFVYVGEEHVIIENAAREYGIGERVTSLPFQPQTTVLQYIAGADIGLVTNGMVNGLGTKIFEYLALGKPVICLVPHGSVIASEFGSTPSVIVSYPPHTSGFIADAIQRTLPLAGHSHIANLESFDRKKTASKLARILDEFST